MLLGGDHGAGQAPREYRCLKSPRRSRRRASAPASPRLADSRLPHDRINRGTDMDHGRVEKRDVFRFGVPQKKW
jgi:hypothetical protein